MQKSHRMYVGILLMLSLVLTIVGSSSTLWAETPTQHNYAEALQKSIYFYDAEKCGPGITGGRLEWRGDCHTEDTKVPLTNTTIPQTLLVQYPKIFDPDGDGFMDLSGGFHDAGDHVRFGMPQSYSFSTLGWGFYHFREAFQETGQEEHMLEILKWFSDCYLRCSFLSPSGELLAFCYMVGEGGTDHTYWGAPELQDPHKCPRPADFATTGSPAADQTASAAAGLALMYLNYREIDATYAQKCLTTAKALYEFARKNPGLGNGDGFYGSSYEDDDLAWAAVWLYVATGNMNYIHQIDSVDANGIYTGYMKKIISTTENTWQNIWVHCWDTVWGGVFTELARLFPTSQFPENKMYKNFDYFSRWNLEYWSGGKVPHDDPADVSYIKPTKAGYAMINTWGSARYNTAAQLCCLVYQKYHPERMDIADWAKSQIDYLLGDNPMGYSYEVGYGEKSAMHPHHRAAHGSKTNSMMVPENHRHVLWGALVGGPDGSDVHKDVTWDYVYNEVAIDYNASFVGALAGHYLLYGRGQKPLANFPPKEQKIDQYYMEARLEQESGERTQITLTLHNESIHPPRNESGMSCRYFFNIKEMLNAGQSIKDLEFQIMYDEQKTSYGGAVKCTGPLAWDDCGTYYIDFDWSGYPIYGDREFQFALVAKQDAEFKSHWDPTNDWSRQGISKLNEVSKFIPVYFNGVKVFGLEPTVLEAPKVQITAPLNNQQFEIVDATHPITINLTATSNNGAIQKAELFANQVKASEDLTSPYSFTWYPTGYNNAAGTLEEFTLSVKATDALGIVGNSAPIKIKVRVPNDPPQPPAKDQIKVLMYNNVIDDSCKNINPYFRIINTSNQPINLAELVLRYYYTIDSNESQVFYCDYCSIDSKYITSKFVPLATPKAGADYYMEIGFINGTGTLAPGKSIDLQARFGKTNWVNYQQNNDYSYNATAKTFVEWEKVTAHLNNQLQWGVEPKI